jgi:ankyrin repeat protein
MTTAPISAQNAATLMQTRTAQEMGNFALQVASLSLEQCRAFLDKKPDAAHWTSDNSGLTALMTAVRLKRNDLVELLLERGAPVSARVSEHGFTAMIYAGRDDNPAAIDILLKYGADIDELSENNETALHQAIIGQHTAAALCLIEKGANVHLRNYNEDTPLTLTGRASRMEPSVCEALLAAGADILASNKQGCTALMHAEAGIAGNSFPQFQKGYIDIANVLRPFDEARRRELSFSQVAKAMTQGTTSDAPVREKLTLKTKPII